MRAIRLIKILEALGKPVDRAVLSKELKISDSTLRNQVRELNFDGVRHGFEIVVMKGQGYYLQIKDPEKYRRYVDSLVNEAEYQLDAEQRLDKILFIILQKNSYITFEKIADDLLASKTTIIRDFKSVESILQQYDLRLEKRTHRGVKVVGNERGFRKAFADYVLNNPAFIEPTKKISDFSQSVDFDGINRVVTEIFTEENITVSRTVYNNIIEHIAVLIYRAKENNFVNNDIELQKVNPTFTRIASKIIQWIDQHYQIEIPSVEIKLLSAQLSGKCVVDHVEPGVREELEKNIRNILQVIDSEYYTTTSSDEELINSLVIHVMPLLNRISNNIQLSNPIVEEVYTEYANVFLLAIKFRDMLYAKYHYLISLDETGFIALHFAAHFERYKLSLFDAFKRIIVICDLGGGNAHLLRTKVEEIFPKAIVICESQGNIANVIENRPDLILTTRPLNIDTAGIPVIRINEWMNSAETQKIQRIIIQNYENKEIHSSADDLKDLFHPELYLRDLSGDYMDVIRQMGKVLIDNGYAEDNYTDLVVERENKFKTIFKNGVAGPHPVYFNAKRDSICVATFPDPIEYEGNEVKLIVMINLRKGHLFLHKEISGLLLKMIENDQSLEAVMKANDYQQFMFEVEKLLK